MVDVRSDEGLLFVATRNLFMHKTGYIAYRQGTRAAEPYRDSRLSDQPPEKGQELTLLKCVLISEQCV